MFRETCNSCIFHRNFPSATISWLESEILSAVMVARNRMCICSSLQTRKLFVLEIFLCCSQVTIQKILLFVFREPLPLLQRWKVIVVDLVGRVLHVSTNGAELDHKCIDPLNDQRAYFNTTAIFEKDIVLLKDIYLPF